MNLVILHGRLTKDPEVRYTQSGKAVASFTVATDEGYGENKKAQFTNCVAWEKTAEIIGNNFAKGREIMVRGKLQTRTYDAKDGSKRYVTEVVLDSFGGMEFCGSKGNTGSNQSFSQSSSNGFDSQDVPDTLIPF